MNTTIDIQKQPENKQIIITHSYQHPVETLWKAFTTTEMLEQWWAPKPYKAVVIENNFETGGYMHYYMLGPNGDKHYCLCEFLDIDPLKGYKVTDAFCDENRKINTDLPRLIWNNTFSFENGTTTVVNTLTFDTEEDMKKLLEMQFEEGYRTGLNQLNDLLNKH